MDLRPYASYRTMRWANGAGVTREISCWPNSEHWSFRLSLADVDQDGPFSTFNDVDRSLVVAGGNGMTLIVDGVEHELRKFDSIHFPGEAEVVATLTDGPATDLNLMVRRESLPNRLALRIARLHARELIALSHVVSITVLEGALAVATPVDTFPFNPTTERVNRFDSVLFLEVLSAQFEERMDPHMHAYQFDRPAITASRDSLVAIVESTA